MSEERLEAQETDNTSVEEEVVESTEQDVSDSSSDEQQQDVNLAEMDRETLEQEYSRVRETNQKLVQNMRDQSKKRREELLEDQDGSDLQSEDEDDEVEELTVDDIDRLVEQKVEQKLQQSTAQQHSTGWQDYVYNQSWGKQFAPETKGSDEKFVALMKEVKERERTANPQSKEEYQKMVRLAASSVLNSEEPLMAPQRRGLNPEEQRQREFTGAPSASAGAPAKPRISARQREIAEAFGHNPEDVYKN